MAKKTQNKKSLTGGLIGVRAKDKNLGKSPSADEQLVRQISAAQKAGNTKKALELQQQRKELRIGRSTPGAESGPQETTTRPDLTNPQGIIEYSNEQNRENASAQTRLNNPNVNNPYGSQNVTYDANGNPTITQSLNPYEQRLLDQERDIDYQSNQTIGGLQQQANKNFSQPLDFNGISEIPGQEDLAGARKRVEDQLYQGYSARLNERFKQDDESFRQRMANEGVSEGSEKYNRLFGQYKQSQTDANQQALNAATEQGGAEQERYYNQGLTSRQQGINERMTQRRAPLDEMGGLIGMRRGSQNPQFQGYDAGQISAVDSAGIAAGMYGADLDNASRAADREQARKQFLRQDATQRMGIAKAGSGGGAEGPDWQTKFNLTREAAREDEDRRYAREDVLLERNRARKPSAGSQFGAAAGAAGGAFANAAASAYGTRYGSGK